MVSDTIIDPGRLNASAIQVSSTSLEVLQVS
jgi:hypothetical protein